MVFVEDELHCDSLLLKYCSFRGSLLGHTSWQTFLKYYFSSIIGVVKGPFFLLYLEISKSNSTYASSMAF